MAVLMFRCLPHTKYLLMFSSVCVVSSASSLSFSGVITIFSGAIPVFLFTISSICALCASESSASGITTSAVSPVRLYNLTGETADVVIPEAELSDAQRAQIEDIVKRKTGIAPENIVITPLKESEDAEDTTQTDETSADTSYEEDSETSAQPYEDTAIDTTDIYD